MIDSNPSDKPSGDVHTGKTVDVPDLGFFSTSIVTYRPNLELLNRTLSSLRQALAGALTPASGAMPAMVTLVDNGGDTYADKDLRDLVRADDAGVFSLRVISGQGNVGYGKGHNLALEAGTGRYHLVLNPDVDLAPDALKIALQFMDGHPEVGLLAPHIDGEDGKLQYLCRRHPTVLDLFARGFLPPRIRAMFAERLRRYELRDLVDRAESGAFGSSYLSPPIISGCFMLFRSTVLRQIEGFDPRYFLYFEDYDLCLRAGAVTRIAYVPGVHIIHFGGGASRKGWLHIKLFASSAYKFFNRFGWRWA